MQFTPINTYKVRIFNSDYIRTENKPDGEGSTPAEPAKPADTEAN